jgi:hypothetical protein
VEGQGELCGDEVAVAVRSREGHWYGSPNVTDPFSIGLVASSSVISSLLISLGALGG